MRTFTKDDIQAIRNTEKYLSDNNPIEVKTVRDADRFIKWELNELKRIHDLNDAQVYAINSLTKEYPLEVILPKLHLLTDEMKVSGDVLRVYGFIK